jgi:CRP-like cAMP-binding protein
MRKEHWFLKDCRLLKELPAERLAQLEADCLFRVFPKGSPIYLPADPAASACLVAAGRVKLAALTPDGKEAIIAFMDPGDWFGELALFHAGPRDEIATAAARSEIVLIPADALRRMAEEFPLVSIELSRLFGLKRMKLERRLKSLLFRSCRERLEALLDELTAQYGRRTGEGHLVEHRLSHQELASLIGVTRETVTLLLAEMQREHRLLVRRRQFVLLAPGPLRQPPGMAPANLLTTD